MKAFVQNRQRQPSVASRWKAPLLAVADPGDSLFPRLRQWASPTHAMPQDLLPGVKSVISFFIPFAERIPRSNRGGQFSSKTWAKAYVATNTLIAELGQFLAQNLQRAGYPAVALPPTHNYNRLTLTSDWSHKHVAYIAGLGDFGFHHLFITEKGCCGRLGSILTTLSLEPTRRPGTPFCLYKRDGSCLKCVDHCSFGALKPTGYDPFRCSEVCDENDRYHHDLGSTAVCGKCACVVPCSFTNPAKM